MKTRTQVLLDPRHEAFLRRQAKERNCSISAALRSLLDEKINATVGDSDPFAAMAGSVDGEHGPAGRQAEDLLYGP